MVEVAVLGYDVVSSGSDGAVHKLIVVLIDVAKQMEAEEGLAINYLRMMRIVFIYKVCASVGRAVRRVSSGRRFPRPTSYR